VPVRLGPVGPGVVSPRPVNPDVANGLGRDAVLGREQRCSARVFSLLLPKDADGLVRRQPHALRHCRWDLYVHVEGSSCRLEDRGPEEWF